MSEFEPIGMEDSVDDIGRLIPAIPGVEHFEGSIEDLGTLTSDEFNEGSEEDLLEEVSEEIKGILKVFGIEGVGNVSRDEIIQLWSKMEMSQFFIADLALQTTIEKREKLKDELVWPTWKDLTEVSETLDNPYDVRIKLIEQAAQNFMKLGYGRLKAYSLPRRPDEEVAQAHKVQGWLIGLPFLQDLVGQVELDMKSSGSLRPSRMFKISIDEIVRQAKIIDSTETRKQYDPRVSYEARAYQAQRRNIKNTYQIASFALSKFASKK